MTLRPLLSDELLQAYFPRLQRENLVEDNASLAVRLQLGGSGTYRRLSRLPDVLVATAEALGVEVRSLLCQHSLVPFLKCVEPDSVCGSDRDFRDRCYIWHAFRTVVYPRMCTGCVKEDRAILGLCVPDGHVEALSAGVEVSLRWRPGHEERSDAKPARSS